MTTPYPIGHLWWASLVRRDGVLGVDIASHLLSGGPAEDSFGVEDHQDDQDQEDHRLRPVRAEAVRAALVEGLDDADGHAADAGAGQGAYAAAHRGRQD